MARTVEEYMRLIALIEWAMPGWVHDLESVYGTDDPCMLDLDELDRACRRAELVIASFGPDLDVPV